MKAWRLTAQAISAMTRAAGDPCTNLNFRAEFEGLEVDSFCHISGLESLVEVVDDTVANKKKPGTPRCANIILRRALDDRRDLWNWYNSTLCGEKIQRNGYIVILDETHEEFLRIKVGQAWPCRWTLGSLESLQPEVLLEEIELVVASLQVK